MAGATTDSTKRGGGCSPQTMADASRRGGACEGCSPGAERARRGTRAGTRVRRGLLPKRSGGREKARRQSTPHQLPRACGSRHDDGVREVASAYAHRRNPTGPVEDKGYRNFHLDLIVTVILEHRSNNF
ncbi:hypothetical protein ZWY2020_033971 [Hordeum vulgare]|nr:hypothetical protein ZWY2020_033971 [Hordeum vulgare]